MAANIERSWVRILKILKNAEVFGGVVEKGCLADCDIVAVAGRRSAHFGLTRDVRNL